MSGTRPHGVRDAINMLSRDMRCPVQTKIRVERISQASCRSSFLLCLRLMKAPLPPAICLCTPHDTPDEASHHVTLRRMNIIVS